MSETATMIWKPVSVNGMVLPTGTFFRYRMMPGEEKTYARVAFMVTEPNPGWSIHPKAPGGKPYNLVSSRRNQWHCSDVVHEDRAVDLADVTFRPNKVVPYTMVKPGAFFVPASDAAWMFVDAEHWMYTADGYGVEQSFRQSLIDDEVPCETYVAVLRFGDGTELAWKGGK